MNRPYHTFSCETHSLAAAQILVFLVCFVSPLLFSTSFAAVIHVPDDHPTIRQAMNAAADADEIIVSPNTYYENINVGGKNIILRSTDPTSETIVASTIIDGCNSDTVVTFSGTELTSCVLSGFTITNGYARRGGGIYGAGTLATIQHNTITTNSAWDSAGGLFCCSGSIKNNAISGNSAGNGAGLRWCDGTIENNMILTNRSDFNGGGLDDCAGTIQGNTISDNLAQYGGGLAECDGIIQNNTVSGNKAHNSGAGLYQCEGVIRNNIIAGNTVLFGSGGGLYGCNGIIENNTIWGNTASGTYSRGGGLYECIFATIRNCIIWQNTASLGPQLRNCSIPTYSCIKDWTGEGIGNISSDPRFVDPANDDFHLEDTSPCIDAGDPDPDYNDACRPPGKGAKRNDMGAYGGPNNCAWLPPPPEGLVAVYDFQSSTAGWNYSTLSGYSLPDSSWASGMICICSPNDGESRFGFWQTDPGVVVYEAGQIYRARYALHTDQITSPNVPTIRLRFTTEQFTGSSAQSIVSLASCCYGPPCMGTKEYRLLYYPAAADNLGLAIDMLDFAGDEWGTIGIASVIVESFSRSVFAGTAVKTYDSDGDFAAWEWSADFGNTTWSGCTSGHSGGTISITSAGAGSEGQAAFWQSPANDLTYVADKLYRATFTMSRGAGNAAATMPWCRIRCFNEDGQMSQEFNINNGDSGAAMPPETPATRDYEVYWQTPDLPASPTTDEDGFRVAIDMLNFAAGETGTHILDRVIIEYSDIPAYSTP
jgi:hypothetical protein